MRDELLNFIIDLRIYEHMKYLKQVIIICVRIFLCNFRTVNLYMMYKQKIQSRH